MKSKAMRKILGIMVSLSGFAYIIFHMLKQYPLETTLTTLFLITLYRFALGSILILSGLVIFYYKPKPSYEPKI